MTLFSSVLPFNLFIRALDIFLNEGWKVLYRTALAILKIKEKEILSANSFEKVMEIVKDFESLEKYDEDNFFKIAMNDFIFSKKLIY